MVIESAANCALLSAVGLIMPNGEINWNCPCLGGMASGPCGYQFQSAFSCFHHSESEPKGKECFEQFMQMQQCMTKYPALYGTDKDDEDREEDFAQLEQQASDSNEHATDSSSTEQPSS